MANCLLAHQNHVITGTLTAGSEVAGLTVGNLQNPHGNPAFAWRTAQGALSSGQGAWFQCDAGAATAAWRVFCVARTNLTTTAQAQVRVANDTAFSAPSYDSGRITVGVAAGVGQFVLTAPAPVQGRYCRVDFFNASNPDGHISAALAFLGPAWQPGVNFSPETAMVLARGQQLVRARGGGAYVTPLYRERGWALAFDALSASEVWTELVPLEAAAAEGRNVLFVPDPAAGAGVQREAVLGLLETTSDVGFATLDGQRRRWRARIVERL